MTFRDQPIRRKLITVILITSGVVLTMTCGTFLTYELVTFRQDMVRRLSMLGQVVAANSTASLAFENPTDGVQVLSALSADPHIVAAALYDEGGALFATYPEHAPVAFPARPDPDGHRFGAARLVLSSPVAMADRRLGTLYLESDLAGLYDRARWYGAMVLAVLVASSMVAVLLSVRLQRHISAPVLALARTARDVSENQDYSLRVPTPGADELGQLTDAFNTMLARVEQQDRTLRDRGNELQREVAERLRAEQGIRALNADLERRVAERTHALAAANKELESFSYSVSHDLRAPLRHVMGYVEMLQDATAGTLSDVAQRYMKTIRDASAEMGQLIDDLLAFSRMGRTELQQSRVDLQALVHETIRGLELATRERHIEWMVEPLPAVLGDRSMLKQLLMNLLDNAVKYSRMRDPARITIGRGGVEDGRLVVFVRDNGAGFDMRYAQKLFGVFQRLHRADEFEGTGIGLATVQRIVARHVGRIWAEIVVDEGVTCSFTLQPADAVANVASAEQEHHELAQTDSAR